MKTLQMIAVLFLAAGTTITTASEKAARQDQFNRKSTAKAIQAGKDARKFYGSVQTAAPRVTPPVTTTPVTKK